jgi:hypothetical protein
MNAMTLLNAPAYDDRKERRRIGLLIGIGVSIALFAILWLGGYILGHGWFFSNLPAEHRVSTFFDALEAKDYAKAYGIWYNDPDWQQHPQKYDYTLQRFTEDWTTESPVKAPITSHHIDISKTDGSGAFGTGIIVATRVNGDHKVFMYYIRKDGTLEWPAPHELEY